MADDADVALMLWDGQSSGTIVNVARLVSRSKPTVIYSAPTKTFATLKAPEELIEFLSAADPGVRAKLDDYITSTSPNLRNRRSSDRLATPGARRKHTLRVDRSVLVSPRPTHHATLHSVGARIYDAATPTPADARGSFFAPRSFPPCAATTFAAGVCIVHRLLLRQLPCGALSWPSV
jgi:hypothetical protein